MELDGYLGALGQLPTYDQLRMNALAIRGAQLQNQQAEQQIGVQQRQADYQQQQQQAYGQAIATLGNNPTPEAYRAIGARFPQYHAALEQAAAGLETGQRQQLASQTGQIRAALMNKRPDLAKSIVQRHIDADKAAGREPDPEDVALIGMIDSGDPQQLQAAQGILYAMQASLNPDTAAKNTGEYGGGDFTLSPGSKRFDATGKVIAQAEFAPRTEQVPVYDDQGNRVGTQLITEGGGPASGSGGARAGGSGGAPSGRYQYGWTPRARNGGDNTDAAVDGKISGMASNLGIGADTPFPSGMSNLQIAKALTLSEGGRGSIADRNNNPGNLRDPKTGDYRKFATKDAGLAAAAAQVARNRARGQNSIRSMVEGLPAGGGAPAAQGPAGMVGPVPSQKARPQRMTPQEVAAEGLDPNTVYYRNADGVPQPVGGQSKATTSTKPVPTGVEEKVGQQVEVRDTLERLGRTFKNDFAGSAFAGLENTAQGFLSGVGTPGQRDWWSDFYTMDNVVRNQLFGTALSAGEQAAYERTTVTPSMDPKQIRSNISRRLAIVKGALARRQRVLKANGYSPEAVDEMFSGPGGGTTPTAKRPAAAAGGFRILRVRPK